MPYVDALNLKYFSDTPPQIPALQTGAIDGQDNPLVAQFSASDIQGGQHSG